ncbi:MAG: restriction endonuclease subunit R, partial [Acidobacteriota bacterium]|nr:restriction endonuclease subunit R [Acidobacteriota bacterium]
MASDEILKSELEKAVAECKRLREENARLRLRVGQALDTRAPTPKQFLAHDNKKAQAAASITAASPPELKVALFRSLFRGRDDVYATRWEGRSGKTGYSPAGIREWDQAASSGRGQKRSFRHSKLFPLSEEVIRDHLLGKQTIGVYPLVQDDTCWFVAVDFDKRSWEADACAFLKTCHETGVA